MAFFDARFFGSSFYAARFWVKADATPPPPSQPGGEGGLPVGGGNIWYTPEMLRRYRESQARLRKYEPEDDREALRAIVARAVRGLPEQEPVPVVQVAKAIQAEAGAELDLRVTLKEIRSMLAEVERLQMLQAQRDEEEMMIVGWLG